MYQVTWPDSTKFLSGSFLEYLNDFQSQRVSVLPDICWRSDPTILYIRIEYTLFIIILLPEPVAELTKFLNPSKPVLWNRGPIGMVETISWKVARASWRSNELQLQKSVAQTKQACLPEQRRPHWNGWVNILRGCPRYVKLRYPYDMKSTYQVTTQTNS